jgi:hypothetical protein
MQINTTRNVSEIPARDRLAIEGILGGPLASDQHVFIAAYTPGAVPSESARAEAKQRLAQSIATNQAFAQQHGISAANADEAAYSYFLPRAREPLT